MDYTKASKVRKKSLSEIIAKKKFEEGQGLGSSIKQAISEKMQAKAMGLKEKFHPMRLVGALTGKGVIGKSIRTIAGRAMGLSNDDVEHFGGYRKKFKRKHLSDLNITGIPDSLDNEEGGQGESVGATAVILEKIFEFMKSNREEDKLKREVENSFREEQLDEDERRHKELVTAIKEYTKNNKSYTGEKTDDRTWWQKLMDNIKEIWDYVKTFIDPIINAIKSVFKGLGEILLGAVGFLKKIPGLGFKFPGIAAYIGAAPLALLGLGALAAADNGKGENTETQTNVLNKIHEKTGYKPTSPDNVVPDEDLKKDGLFGMSSAKKARKKRIENSFELGTTYSPETAEKIKKAYNIDVPKENIAKEEPVATENNTNTTPENKQETPQTSNKTGAPATEVKKSEPAPKEEVKPKSNATVQTKETSVPTPNNATPKSVPPPVINQSPGTMLPKQLGQEDTNSENSTASVVAVNNSSTTVDGPDSKVVSVDSTRVRDPNIARHLRPVAV